MLSMNENLSKLTTIPKASLDKLDEKRCFVICDELDTAIKNCESIVSVDIGIGRLIINITDSNIVYKFIPNALLEKSLKDVVLDGVNPLTGQLEKTIASRIINTYKDLF